MGAVTEFELRPGVPMSAIFVDRYDAQFGLWAREFRKRGRRAALVFDRVPGKPVLFDGEGREIVRGCWLEAEVERVGEGVRVVIVPASEHDADMIERHARELKGWLLS